MLQLKNPILRIIPKKNRFAVTILSSGHGQNGLHQRCCKDQLWNET